MSIELSRKLVSADQNPSSRCSPVRCFSISVTRRRPSESFISSSLVNWRPNTFAAMTKSRFCPSWSLTLPSGS